MLTGCYINWGRIKIANHVDELFIGKMEGGEFAVNAFQDGVDEVVDGIVMGRCLVRYMMWLGWNIGLVCSIWAEWAARKGWRSSSHANKVPFQ